MSPTLIAAHASSEPSTRVRARLRRHRDPAQMRLWRRLHALFGGGKSPSEIPEPQLVLLALPLQDRQLRTQPLALRDPRRRSVGVVGRRASSAPAAARSRSSPGIDRRSSD